jgi:hypothetical protein
MSHYYQKWSKLDKELSSESDTSPSRKIEKPIYKGPALQPTLTLYTTPWDTTCGN